MRGHIRSIGWASLLALFVAACSPSGDESAASSTTTSTAPEPTTTSTSPASTTTQSVSPTLAIDVVDWPELKGGFHYEGWAIIDDSPVTTGKFNVTDVGIVGLDGAPIDSFPVDGIEAATAIIITIEPAGDNDDIPSDTHFVAGDVAGGSANLSIDHPAAIGTDFSDAAGTFLLATPTDDDDSNELSGIWFLELPGPTPSLDLPELPAGWKYEGWAIIDDLPQTSGTFLTAAGADDAAPFSGPSQGPAFPGEDYLTNAPAGVTFPTDLSGGTVVISVEPFPDDDPAPFILKPLIGFAAEDATDHESYPLLFDIGQPPLGTATISP